ncbi:MAG: hypothetical protein EAX90_09580 [Candidatus Heimdallarchaeota archaeon]|nr:hypothetical protein [Candidatus Heimdallarchaeota archaeon]
MINFSAEIEKLCLDPDSPCAVTFSVSEKMQTFTEIIEIFSSRGFVVKEFIDDHLCVLSRDNEGFNEAVKIKNNKIQIQALKTTLVELCDDLQIHCTKMEYV